MMKMMTLAGTTGTFIDDRGSQRALRMSWHAEHRIVVFSIWEHDHCAATFRLPVDQVPSFVQGLTSGLANLAIPSQPQNIQRDELAHKLVTEAPPAQNGPAESAPAQGVADHPATGRRKLARKLSRGLDSVINDCDRLRTWLDRL